MTSRSRRSAEESERFDQPSTEPVASVLNKEQRVKVGDRYDVIIRPDSPPFVTVVPAGRVIPAVPHSGRAHASQDAKVPQYIKTTVPSLALTESGPVAQRVSVAELNIRHNDERSADGQDRSRIERIYSPVARELSAAMRTETTGEAITRAIELLPIGKGDATRNASGSLTIKTSSNAQQVIHHHFYASITRHESTLMRIRQESLDQLWNDGKGHIQYNEFVQQLRDCPGNVVHWADLNGRIRTLRPALRRPFARTIKTTDLGSSSDSLKRGITRFKQGARGYVELDAASVLAIACLAANDAHNFARIVAAAPGIVEVLLDSKKVGHGPIFTDQTIWLVLAYTIPRLRAYGGQTTNELKALTLAFENYLCFHNPSNLKGPYVEPIKWSYDGSGQQADALANSAVHFAQCIEQIWVRLCPEDNSPRDVLDRAPVADHLDCELAAYMINIIFSGVDFHLSQVISRRKAYSKAINRLVSIGGAVPFDALKGAAGGLDGGVAGGAIAKIGDLFLAEAGSAIAKIHADSNFEQMKTAYATLYTAVGENAEEGRFVPGQCVMTAHQMRALMPDAARGPVNQSDVDSPEGDPSSIRRRLQSQYTGVDTIVTQEEFESVRRRRTEVGTFLAEKMKKINKHNLLTPSPNRSTR